ncbi:spermidine/putrescine ABC transporter permease [Clostridia bacterium]|nr:spermidine/putrescine ABC transporter permease [Clostridia bacterium]
MKAKSKFFLSPYAVWVFLFTIIPLIMVAYYSFTVETDSGVIVSLDNFKRVVGSLYIGVIWKSIKIALIATGVCLLLGYPAAYILATREYSKKTILLFLFIVPMWMNSLLRTYAWFTLLQGNGPINSVLGAAQGIVNSVFGTSFAWKLDILYKDAAVYLGMVYNFLPFMILPIYTVLVKLDSHLVEAAQDLGAPHSKVFTKIVFPLSVPGVVSGITMVFMPAVTTFFIPSLLGGGQYILVGNLIERNFLALNDWHFGSTISLVLMIVMLISMGILSAIDKNKDKEAEGGAMF